MQWFRVDLEEAAKLRAQLHALPKVDLHRHLEGSLRLQTLAEIAKEHGIDLPSYDIEYLRPFVTVTDDEPDFVTFVATILEETEQLYSRPMRARKHLS